MLRRRWLLATIVSVALHVLLLALLRTGRAGGPAKTEPRIGVELVQTPRRPQQTRQPAQPHRPAPSRARAPKATARGGGTKPPSGAIAARRPEENGTSAVAPPGLSLDLDPQNLLGPAGPPAIGIGGQEGIEAEPERGGTPTSDIRYFSFLVRLEDRVGHVWIGRIERDTLALDPSGRRYSTVDRTTLISFALDRRGEVRGTKVVRSSGVDHLDAAAFAAVAETGPFLNPPADLFQGAQERRFLFSFTLLAAGGTSPHLTFR